MRINSKLKSLPNTIHVKKGDKVIVISGKDKGKVGEVKKVFTKKGKVLVESLDPKEEAKINLITRATKPSGENPRGGLVKKEAPLASCKVMLYDESLKKGVKAKKVTLENGKKVRVSKKSDTQFD